MEFVCSGQRNLSCFCVLIYLVLCLLQLFQLFGFWLLCMLLLIWPMSMSRTAFYLFSSNLGSCLGFVLAGDLITLFVFYEAVTFLSHILVTHEHTPAANSAGNGMLYLGIIGSFFLLLGIYQLYTGVGTLEIKPLFDQIAQSGLNSYWLLIYLLSVLGLKPE